MPVVMQIVIQVVIKVVGLVMEVMVEELLAAADAYSVFLRELAAYRKTPDELGALLDAAEAKLAAAFDAAR